MFKPKNLKEAIIATLSYFKIWNHPLTLAELTQYLFKWSDDIRHIQLYMQESPKIEEKDGLFYLKGNSQDVIERYGSKKNAAKLWKKTKKYAWIFQLVPFIRMVAVCNTLAIGHANGESDIDLFIITKKDRLFTARTIITGILHMLGVRRHGNKIRERFCLSFFVDENNLNLESLQLLPYDIYLAYWTKTLKPLIGKKTHLNFLKKNQSWLKRYFEKPAEIEKTYLLPSIFTLALRPLQFLIELLLTNPMGDYIEKKLQKWQVIRANIKKQELKLENGHIIIKKNILKFHNIDRRKEYREKWEENIRKILNIVS